MRYDTANERFDEPGAATRRAFEIVKRTLGGAGTTCSRDVSHGRATSLMTIGGKYVALCRQCARAHDVDRQVTRQREERARMRSR